MRDAWRLAVGTLTVLPVPPPRVVDPRTAGRAMALAPAVGLLTGVPVLVVLLLLDGRSSPLLTSVLAVAMLALLTRGLHLDGLADTADGLGSGRPAEQALALMRRGDVGPFGVVTVVLVLLLQVAALASEIGSGGGPAAVLVALAVSRLALPLLCSRGVPAARPDGLGSVVAGSVSRPQLAGAAAVAVLAVACAGWLAGDGPAGVVRLGLAAVPALLVAAGLAGHCVRRLGGVTGDVLGAGVEVAFGTCLVVLALT